MGKGEQSTKSKLPVLQIVIGVAAVGAAFWTGSLFQKVRNLESRPQVAGEQAAQPAGQPEKKQVVLPDELWNEIKSDAQMVLGVEGAKVTIVEFTDYQCPFCARYSEQTFSQLKTEYIDTGKVRYILRDLPLGFHQNAKPAALAARCAGDKYWEMHDKIFEGQSDWESGDGEEEFKAYAGELGVEGFDECFDENRFKKEIEDDAAMAGKVGATGTPSFFVNGKKIEGAQPFSVFKDLIEAELE